MKIYRVGGAVRDKLLSYPVYDNDWVVVGSSPEEMKSLGYLPVGADFPVFIHSESGEEYALARTERKSGKGYTGFQFYASPEVTLEQDLLRRDLTINAMAESEHGEIIDPYNGQADLENRVLRHVSAAFAEDPLRVLRTARFSARYHHLGFSIAPETMELMTEISSGDELEHLTAERVWKELERALTEASPWIFFETLHHCGADRTIYPPLLNLQKTDGYAQWKSRVQNTDTNGQERFAALLTALSLDDVETPETLIKQLCDHLKAPKAYSELSLLLHRCYSDLHSLKTLTPEQLQNLIQQGDFLRRPERLPALLRAFALLEEPSENLATNLADLINEFSQIDAKHFIAQGYKGAELGAALKQERIRLCADFLGKQQ